ncbi:MAG: Uma2 family endonuclease [Armatimonadota bacterium]
MSAAVPEPTHTPESLLKLAGGGKGFKLVKGRLVKKGTGSFASWVAARILQLLATLGQDQGLGWALESGASYQCFRNHPRKVRRPDVSFIRRGRLPEERIPRGHVRIAPDLAVEVLSPNDTAYEIDLKVEEYLRAGVPLVWRVNPELRAVHVYRADGTVERLGDEDELTAPELIPDLRCRVGALFTLPEPR